MVTVGLKFTTDTVEMATIAQYEKQVKKQPVHVLSSKEIDIIHVCTRCLAPCVSGFGVSYSSILSCISYDASHPLLSVVIEVYVAS